MFESNNIILKKLRREDLGILLELKFESWETTHHITIATLEDQIRWFDSLDKDVHTPKNLMLIAYGSVNETKSRIGVFKISSIDWANRTAEVAWDVFKDHRGQGFGKSLVVAGSAFCFKILNLHRLNCEILELNEASKKCAIATGYQKEGIKRESVVKFGSYVDSGIYGLLLKDFAALHRSALLV
jgi:ribosomal-protein-alanine N-acetyltransferase